MGDCGSEHVRHLKDKQVFCDRETEKIPSLVENGDSMQRAEQGNMACDNSEHDTDLDDQPVFCDESNESLIGMSLQQKKGVLKLFDEVSNQADPGAFKDEERDRGETNGLREHEEHPYNGSKTVEETPSPEMDTAGERELEEQKIKDHDCHKNEKKNKARTPSVSSDDKGFEQQKDQFKSYMTQRMCELEKQHSVILEKFAQASDMARPLVKDTGFVIPLTRVEKEEQLVQNELRQVHDESTHAFKKSRMGKAKYKKLKKRFRCNNERINSLFQAYQRDLKERKEKETDFQHQIQHDIGQIRILLKEALKNEVTSSEEGEQSTDKDEFENHLKEMNDILEKIILRLKRNENEQELKRTAVRQENRKVQGLEKGFQEFKTRLEENECDLESIKRKLKERDDRIEELNLKLQQEREDTKGLRKSIELVKGHARQQTMDKDSELSILRRVLSETREHSDKLQEQLRRIQRELEDTEDTLTQRETELTKAKDALCQGDGIICDFKQTLTLMKHELEETKKALVAKDKALDTVSRYADDDVKVLKELVTNIIRDVKTVEQAHVKLQSLLVGKNKTIEDRKLFIVQLKDGLETVIFELKKDLDLNISSLKEKDKRVEELELSITPLKKDLEIKTSSLGEKDSEIKDLESSIAQCKNNLELSFSYLKERNNKIDDLEASITQLEEDMEVASISLNGRNKELQKIQGYVQDKEREINISTGKGILLQEENNCLKNKYMMSKTRLCQQQDEIQGLKKLAFTRNSELREGNRELKKLRQLLQEKEQRIDFMKRSLAAKEHDNDILTGNMKKRFFEIRNLQRTLDEMNNEKRKLSELYRLKTSYFETKIKRLNMEVECNHILLGKKERALETASLGIQTKEGELDILKDRLCKQEMRFELYKKISTEAEYKLLQEKRSLEKVTKVEKTELCEKDCGSLEVKSSSNAKESDLETKDDWSSDESNRIEWDGKGAIMIDGKVEEQIAVTGTDRSAQMEGNIIAFKKELERSQDNNAILSKKNKELKEKVNKLQKQAVEERKRLNNTADNVHIEATEIHRLKTLLQQQDEERSIEDDDIQQLPEATVAGVGTKVPQNVKETDDSQMRDEVPQESGESQLQVDDAMQETAEPNILVDDPMKDVLEPQVQQNAAQKRNDWSMTENAQQESDESQLQVDDAKQETTEPNIVVDDHMKDVLEPQMQQNAAQKRNDWSMTENAQQESDESQLQVDDAMQETTEPNIVIDDHMKDVLEPQMQENAAQERNDWSVTEVAQQGSGEPQLPVVDDGQGLAESQVEEFPQEKETPESSISCASLSSSDLGF